MTITVTNKAHWEGQQTSEGGGVEDTNWSYTAGGTVGTVTTPKIKLHKVDQYNNHINLPGAEFKLTEVKKLNGSSFEDVVGGKIITATTDETGWLSFGTGSDLLAWNTVYEIEETKAPNGYVLEANIKKILVAKEVDGKYPDYTGLGNDVTVWYSSDTYSYTVYNHQGEIDVTKAFANVDGTSIGNLSGTYTFGLFDNPNGTGSPIQTRKLTVSAAQPDTKVTFQNVEFGKIYYIFELDDTGQAIQNDDSATVGGVPFVVRYDRTSLTVSADTPTATVIVTNQINYPELPNTGGIGRIPCTAGGILLITAAIFLFYKERKRRKGDRTYS